MPVIQTPNGTSTVISTPPPIDWNVCLFGTVPGDLSHTPIMHHHAPSNTLLTHPHHPSCIIIHPYPPSSYPPMHPHIPIPLPCLSPPQQVYGLPVAALPTPTTAATSTDTAAGTAARCAADPYCSYQVQWNAILQGMFVVHIFGLLWISAFIKVFGGGEVCGFGGWGCGGWGVGGVRVGGGC